MFFAGDVGVGLTMTRFQKVFLRDQLGERVYAAAFGKHPAWDDHIDDIGLVTETMVLAKQLLYSQGIASQLASGAWDQIERAGQSLEFDHRFVWARKQQTLIGAIHASSDGKGRARFPMVVSIQAPVNGLRAAQIYLPQAEKLGTRCKAARTRDEFRAAVDQANKELNAFRLLSDAQPGVAHPEVGDDSTAIELGAQLLKASKDPRDSRFRLPAVSARVQDNLEFWAGYIECHVQPHQPFFLVAAVGAMPIDLRIGEPESNDWFCLRAKETALPITKPKEPASPHLERLARAYLEWFRLGTGPQPNPSPIGWRRLFGW
jgi:hypothetical protein